MNETPQEKVCSKCGLSKPLDDFAKKKSGKYGRQPHCRTCKNAYGVVYSANNRDKLREYQISRIDIPKVVPEEKSCTACQLVKPIAQFGRDKYTTDGHATRCKDCKRSESESFRHDNPEQVRAASARWQANNPEKVQAYTAFYAPKKSVINKSRYQENKAFINAQNTARHAARQFERHNQTTDVITGVNDLSTEQVLELREAYNGLCQYCDRLLKEGQYSIDHVIPLSRGGWNTLANVVLSCRACNAKKRNGPPLRPVYPLLVTVARPKIPTQKGV